MTLDKDDDLRLLRDAEGIPAGTVLRVLKAATVTRGSDHYRRYRVCWQGENIWLHESDVEANGLFGGVVE